MFGEVIKIVDGLVGARYDVDGWHRGVPVAGNNENGSGPPAKTLVLPSF